MSSARGFASLNANQTCPLELARSNLATTALSSSSPESLEAARQMLVSRRPPHALMAAERALGSRPTMAHRGNLAKEQDPS